MNIRKAISVLLVIAFTVTQSPLSFAYENLSPALLSDTNLNPDRTQDGRNDIAKGLEPGAIGNGAPLIELIGGKLPERVAFDENEDMKTSLERIRDAIGFAIKMFIENRHLIPPQHKDRTAQTITNLISLENELTEKLYLFHTVVQDPENYLLGFNYQSIVGLDVDFVNFICRKTGNPSILAQYIFHECVPEKDVAGRDDHRAIYTEIQSSIFGQDAVACLKGYLRGYISAKINKIGIFLAENLAGGTPGDSFRDILEAEKDLTVKIADLYINEVSWRYAAYAHYRQGLNKFLMPYMQDVIDRWVDHFEVLAEKGEEGKTDEIVDRFLDELDTPSDNTIGDPGALDIVNLELIKDVIILHTLEELIVRGRLSKKTVIVNRVIESLNKGLGDPFSKASRGHNRGYDIDRCGKRIIFIRDMLAAQVFLGVETLSDEQIGKTTELIKVFVKKFDLDKDYQEENEWRGVDYDLRNLTIRMVEGPEKVDRYFDPSHLFYGPGYPRPLAQGRLSSGRFFREGHRQGYTSKVGEVLPEEALMLAESLAMQAGSIMLKYRSNLAALKQELKDDKTIVTKADQEIQDLIIRSILEKYPDHKFIAEEKELDEKLKATASDEYVWVIDPIDGTGEFVKENATRFGVLITLLKRNEQGLHEPIMGVFYAPMHSIDGGKLGTLFEALDGWDGAYLNGRRIKVHEGTDLEARTGAIRKSSTYARMPFQDRLVEAFGKVEHDTKCTGLEFAETAASGNFNLQVATVHIRPKIWDIAAPLYIVEKAGGIVTDFSGKRYFPVDLARINKDNPRGPCISAASRPVNERVLEIISSTGFDESQVKKMPKKESAPEDPWMSFPMLNQAISRNRMTAEIGYTFENRVMDVNFDLWMARHGETAGNSLKILQGAANIPGINELNDRGREQAKQAAESLFTALEARIRNGKEVIVVTSSLLRAQETARIFIDLVKARTGIELRMEADEDADEISFGACGNAPYETPTQEVREKLEEYGINPNIMSAENDEIRKKWMAGNAVISFENGESFIDVLIRQKRLLERLNRKYAGKTIVMIGHGTQLNAVRTLLGDGVVFGSDNKTIKWRKMELSNAECRQTEWTPVEGYDGKLLVNSHTGQIRFAWGTGPIVKPDYELWSLRHGASVGNEKHILQGDRNDPVNFLSKKGEEQARMGAEELFEQLGESRIRSGNVVYVASGLIRSQQTADAFVKLVKERIGVDIRYEIEPLNNEFCFGEWGNQDRKNFMEGGDKEKIEWHRKWKEEFSAIARPPKGDSFLDVISRNREMMEKFNRLYKGKTVVVFDHGTCITAKRVLLGDRSLVNEAGVINWQKANFANVELRNLTDPQGMEVSPEKAGSILMKLFADTSSWQGTDWTPVMMFEKTMKMDGTREIDRIAVRSIFEMMQSADKNGDEYRALSRYLREADPSAPALIYSTLVELAKTYREKTIYVLECKDRGSIGNGTPLLDFIKGDLPGRVDIADRNYKFQVLVKIRKAIRRALELYNERGHRIPVKYAKKAETAAQNLKLLSEKEEEMLYFFESRVLGQEDYLVGFKTDEFVGLDIELVNRFFSYSVERLAQYIFHECIPERYSYGMWHKTPSRDDHRENYQIIQTAVFGEREVSALGADLRNFIDQKARDKASSLTVEPGDAGFEEAIEAFAERIDREVPAGSKIFMSFSTILTRYGSQLPSRVIQEQLRKLGFVEDKITRKWHRLPQGVSVEAYENEVQRRSGGPYIVDGSKTFAKRAEAQFRIARELEEKGMDSFQAAGLAREAAFAGYRSFLSGNIMLSGEDVHRLQDMPRDAQVAYLYKKFSWPHQAVPQMDSKRERTSRDSAAVSDLASAGMNGVEKQDTLGGAAGVQALKDNEIAYRAELFRNDLKGLLTRKAGEPVVLAIDSDIGRDQQAQLMPIWKVVEEIRNMKNSEGQPLFPNLRVVRGRGEKGDLMSAIDVLRRGEEIKTDNILMLVRDENLRSGIFKPLEGQAWITSIEDSRATVADEGAYLPILEAATLTIMAALKADTESIKRFYDAISNVPIDPAELEEMIKNRLIHILPRMERIKLEELGAKYDLVRNIYLAA